MNRFVISIPVFRRPDGARVGTHYQCVATEERAKEIASGHPERTYRAMTSEESIADDLRRQEALTKSDAAPAQS